MKRSMSSAEIGLLKKMASQLIERDGYEAALDAVFERVKKHFDDDKKAIEYAHTFIDNLD